jgi:UDP-N-acetylmuramoyl-tripeptide--D-alanyl-D-alanine ligase
MIPNNACFSYLDLLSIFGKESFKNISNKINTSFVTIDSRNAAKDCLFVALKGEKLDGNEKAPEAIASGAIAAVVEHQWFDANKKSAAGLPLIVVDNSLNALAKLANYHRRRFDIPIIAIGGSNGKTTTKEMTAFLLSHKYKILKTHENFNNQLGLPLMLLALDSGYECAVLEIGTNEPGEIAVLSNMMEPTHGLLTNIGKEHLEKLLDLDGVEQEETFLFGFLNKTGGTAFINFDDDRLRKYIKVINNYFSFGTTSGADLQADISFTKTLNPKLKLKFQDRTIDVVLRTYGKTTALNALAASAIAFYLGLTDDEIKKGLEEFENESSHSYGRMLVEKVGGIVIINDCYNANPSSMNEAFFTLSNIFCSGKRYAALGDMRELGDSSLDEHIAVIEKADDCADKVIITGSEMLKAFKNLPQAKNIHYFAEKDDISALLKNELKAGDVLLVKGSRGMKMETIVENLKE